MKINIGERTLEGRVETRLSDGMFGGRESKAVTAAMTVAEAAELFSDDAAWSVSVQTVNDDGEEQTFTQDMSAYAVSGPITDNRDGTVTVRMGKLREEELMRIPLAETPKNRAAARRLRSVIEAAVQSIEDDETALTAAALHPEWSALAAAGAQAEPGRRFRHEGGLYRILSAHAFTPDWVPGEGTESLYVRIDETHAGTADDPIPYAGNMALDEGGYYSQDGAVYLCFRSTGAPVYSPLDELVGLYVQVIGA